MASSPPPYSGPKEIRYLFVDGGCLREYLDRTARTYGAGNLIRLDYGIFTQNYTKVFYYDALPGRKADEDEAAYRQKIDPQRRLFDQLSNLDRFHVYEGDVRRSSVRRGPEQKKIDVMIAVDMLTHSFRRNMHEATLLTGDLDFKPLIDALVQEGMYITLWYPPDKTSKELIAAADRSRPLQVDDVHRALREPRPFVIPQVHSEPGKGDYASVLKKWKAGDVEVQLMQNGDSFVLAVPCDHPAGYVTYYDHANPTVLRAYVAERSGLPMAAFPETI